MSRSAGLRGPFDGLRGPFDGLRGPFDGLRGPFDGLRAPVVTVGRQLIGADRAVYRAVAGFSTPALDVPMRLVSHAANFSKPWFAVAVALAAAGGPPGRLAAVTGVAAIGVTSFIVNQPMKLARRRRRPDRLRFGVPASRWVSMPTSASFPSGHSASAAAFAVSVGRLRPTLRWPLRAAAATVAISRVYTGVHYPGDVLVGAAVGAATGAIVSRVALRVAHARVQRAAQPCAPRSSVGVPDGPWTTT